MCDYVRERARWSVVVFSEAYMALVDRLSAVPAYVRVFLYLYFFFSFFILRRCCSPMHLQVGKVVGCGARAMGGFYGDTQGNHIC